MWHFPLLSGDTAPTLLCPQIGPEAKVTCPRLKKLMLLRKWVKPSCPRILVTKCHLSQYQRDLLNLRLQICSESSLV